MYDVLIIGGGPAGISAGIYSARKRLKTLFLTFELGGQSTVSTTVENWIGIPSIGGAELGRQMRKHLESYRGQYLDIIERVKVIKVEKTAGGFKTVANNGQEYESKTILVATGSGRRKLTVPGAAEFEGKGIVYCASCDAPLFDGLAVAVIGGGNAGFSTAGQLLAYAKSVTLLHHNPEFKAEKITVDKVLLDSKMTALTNAEITKVIGDKFVSGLTYLDKTSGETRELLVRGIFVEIGHQPEATAVKDLVALNEAGAIIVDPRTQATNVEGIWAAGDCTDTLYHQNNIAAGQGVVALENIYNFLLNKK